MLICVLMLPVDLARLTVDAWRLFLGQLRATAYKMKEYRCPFCLDCDHTKVPRSMHKEIRYWNGWMIRMLLPHLRYVQVKGWVRKIPICRVEGGYIRSPVYTLCLALFLTCSWTAGFVFLVVWIETG
jgi:hypothetical protein